MLTAGLLGSTPVAAASLQGVVDITTSGWNFACALMASSDVKCWGANIAPGNVATAGPVDVQVSNATAVFAGHGDACARIPGANLTCWGFGFKQEVPGTAGVVDMAMSGFLATHTCAVFGSGQLKCWGSNNHGELGVTAPDYSPTPVEVNLPAPAIGVAVDDDWSCALLNTGAVWCWGQNYTGVITGGPGPNIRFAPMQTVPAGIASISRSGPAMCAVTTAGAVTCWGNNLGGATGSPDRVNQQAPRIVPGLESGVSSVSEGCALTTAGAVKCWGYGAGGELGFPCDDYCAAQQVVGLESGVIKVSGGFGFACALMSSGVVKCWGDNFNGELGITLPAGAYGAILSGVNGTTGVGLVAIYAVP